MKYYFRHVDFFAVILTILLGSCGQNQTNGDDSRDDNSYIVAHSLTLDTFSIFPPEIDGCSCYFSNDSNDFQNRTYIYMNDYSETSFLKINGVLTKFTQTDFKEIDSLNIVAKFKSDKFEMTIHSHDGPQNGDETWLKTGTIELSDKNGRSIKKSFYGECGC